MDIREQIEELLTKEYGWFDPKKVDKLLNLHSVSQQRELLLAYQKWYDDNLNICEIGSIEDCVEGFIANNCG